MTPSEERRFGRQAMLKSLEKGWKTYLPHLAELADEEQLAYAHMQGYLRVQDVLAHIIAWWESSMLRTRISLSGQDAPAAGDVDEFNARAVAEYQSWTRQAVEEKFATTLTALEQFLKDIPEIIFENSHMYHWIEADVVDHYREHRPPNGPAL